MRATEELAKAEGDKDFAATARTAFLTAQTAMDKLQWNASHKFYNAGSNGCVRGHGCSDGIGSFADAFYAQVLSYSLGLGELLADPSRLDSHLAYTAKTNCVHNEVSTGRLITGSCPNGLVIMTERPVELTDLQVRLGHCYIQHCWTGV
jgi:non-lysosomal glucosylceramidase